MTKEDIIRAREAVFLTNYWKQGNEVGLNAIDTGKYFVALADHRDTIMQCLDIAEAELTRQPQQKD